MTNEPEELDANKIAARDLDEYLAGESSLSRDYDALGAEHPPPELDERILAEAERAAKVRRFPFRGKSRRWLDPPVALAATLLLSFSLVMSIITFVPMDSDDGFEPGRRDSNLRQRKLTEPEEVRGTAFGEDASIPASEPVEELVVTSRATREGQMAPEARMERLTRAQSRNQAQEYAGAREIGSIIAVIREQLIMEQRVSVAEGLASGEAKLSADMMVADQPGPESPRVATARKQSDTVSADVRLQEILRLYDGDQEEAAAQAIAEFSRSYPDHPVSVWLLEHGY